MRTGSQVQLLQPIKAVLDYGIIISFYSLLHFVHLLRANKLFSMIMMSFLLCYLNLCDETKIKCVRFLSKCEIDGNILRVIKIYLSQEYGYQNIIIIIALHFCVSFTLC